MILTTVNVKYSVHALCPEYGMLSRPYLTSSCTIPYGQSCRILRCVDCIVRVVEFRSCEMQSMWKIKRYIHSMKQLLPKPLPLRGVYPAMPPAMPLTLSRDTYCILINRSLRTDFYHSRHVHLQLGSSPIVDISFRTRKHSIISLDLYSL
jgi:hypothetical protein